MKRLKKYFNKYMIVPIISQTFTKTVIALAFVYIWDRLANKDGIFRAWALVPPVLAVVFIALAWTRYLIIDGVKLPRLDDLFLRLRKGAARDSTHLNDELDPNGELDEREKDVVSVTSSLICAVVFFIITAIAR